MNNQLQIMRSIRKPTPKPSVCFDDRRNKIIARINKKEMRNETN